MDNEKTFHARVSELVQKLKAPKGQMNKFGGYRYRSCEDIVEAVKPLLDGLVLTISDDIILIGDRYYVKATATLTDGKEAISNTAFAREIEQKKGMDPAQVTGATSSYARKYALNGLLCIDDARDADSGDPKDVEQSQGEYAKKKAAMIDAIKIELSKQTNGKTAQEKGAFLYNILGVKSFAEFNRMSVPALDKVLTTLMSTKGAE